jgi:hypothetical protein
MFKGRQFGQSVILLCVRWYLAYDLSLRDLEEMMAKRGIAVDHTTIHRWTVRFSPLLLERFNRRKRAVTGKWHVDETYIKVRGQWMYLYRAIDSVGDTVEFYFSAHRDLPAAKRFFTKTLERHGHRRQPDQSRGDRFLLHHKSLAGSLAGMAEADPHPSESLPQQSHRTRSSTHQGSHASDARLQVDGGRLHHPVRYRNDPHDAQATGEVGFQSESVAGGAVRHSRRSMSRKDWSNWLEAAGVVDAELSHGPVLNRASMVIDAAVDGQGVALARTTLAAWDLINGRLVRPFAAALQLSKSYWIISPKATSMLPKITTFRDWLLAEAAGDVRRLKSLAP